LTLHRYTDHIDHVVGELLLLRLGLHVGRFLRRETRKFDVLVHLTYCCYDAWDVGLLRRRISYLFVDLDGFPAF